MAMTGLDKITNKILAEAEKEAAKILDEAKEASLALEADYQKKVDLIQKSAQEDADRQCREAASRASASAETSRRNLLLSTKGQLVDEAFSSAETAVRAYDDDKMLELLTGLLAYAMIEEEASEANSIALYGAEDAILPESYELLLNAKDRERYGQAIISGVGNRLIGKVPTEKLSKLRLSDRTANIGGGFILRYGDIESNCSFDLLFAELRQTLEIEVSRALFETPKKA